MDGCVFHHLVQPRDEEMRLLQGAPHQRESTTWGKLLKCGVCFSSVELGCESGSTFDTNVHSIGSALDARCCCKSVLFPPPKVRYARAISRPTVRDESRILSVLFPSFSLRGKLDCLEYIRAGRVQFCGRRMRSRRL